jgi:hypothetical protein
METPKDYINELDLTEIFSPSKAIRCDYACIITPEGDRLRLMSDKLIYSYRSPEPLNPEILEQLKRYRHFGIIREKWLFDVVPFAGNQ